jgi:hypothetical protein
MLENEMGRVGICTGEVRNLGKFTARKPEWKD